MVSQIYFFVGLPSHPFFRSSNTSFLSCLIIFVKKIKNLEHKVFAKNRRNTNLFGLFYFHNYLEWENLCHYEQKFKIQKVE